MNPLAFPKLEKYLNDFSGVLISDQISSLLNEIFAEHEISTTEQVVVVLIPHRQWNELLDIGLKIFNENGIWQKSLNNGLLLIVATEEKKLRIIVWKWLELKYTEMVCRDIVENHLRPLLNEGKYEEMIRLFSYIVQNPLSPSPIMNKNNQLKIEWYWSLLWFSILGSILCLLIFFINWVETGVIMLSIGVVTSIFIWKNLKKYQNIWYYFLFVFPVLFITVGILAILRPGVCTQIESAYSWGNSYQCERDIYGYKTHYFYTIGWPSNTTSSNSSYSSRSSSDSSYSSHSSDSSSSFGGGGGSSNGGGYWD